MLDYKLNNCQTLAVFISVTVHVYIQLRRDSTLPLPIKQFQFERTDQGQLKVNPHTIVKSKVIKLYGFYRTTNLENKTHTHTHQKNNNQIYHRKKTFRGQETLH